VEYFKVIPPHKPFKNPTLQHERMLLHSHVFGLRNRSTQHTQHPPLHHKKTNNPDKKAEEHEDTQLNQHRTIYSNYMHNLK
jgi:hypothetical protein